LGGEAAQTKDNSPLLRNYCQERGFNEFIARTRDRDREQRATV
jgi:hypothetical protein